MSALLRRRSGTRGLAAALCFAVLLFAIHTHGQPRSAGYDTAMARAEPLLKEQRWADAIPHLARARDAALASHGEASAIVYDLEFKLGELHTLTGELPKAIRWSETALATLRRLASRTPGQEAAHLSRLAQYHHAAGDGDRRARTLEEAVAILERHALADDLPPYLVTLAEAQSDRSEHRAVVALARRALALLEKRGDPRVLVQPLNQLAIAHHYLGELREAEAVYRRALEAAERGYGVEHPEVANALSNLATITGDRGDLLAQTALLERALRIDLAVLGEQHFATAGVLHNLSLAWSGRGDVTRSRELAERSLAAHEASVGKHHKAYSYALSGLANAVAAGGKLEEARTLYEQALAVRETALGPEHSDIAYLLGELAGNALERGAYDEVRRHDERSITIIEKSLGREHPLLADALARLGLAALRGGDSLDDVESLWTRALSLRRAAFGDRHHGVALASGNLARAALARGDVALALERQQRSNHIEERLLAELLGGGTDAQRRMLIDTLAWTTDDTIDLHLTHAPNNETAAKLALEALVMLKGRALEVMTHGLAEARLGGDVTRAAKLDELSASRSRLARMVLGGAGDKLAIEAERAIAERLENELAPGAAPAPATLEALRGRLQAGEALVELAVYAPRTVRDLPTGAPRYAAYVLRPGHTVRGVALGTVSAIDDLVRLLRTAMSDPTRDVRPAARALFEAVVAPILPLLEGVERLRLSPEGQLHLVPFGATLDGDGRYLVQRFELSYLASGRDLARTARRPAVATGAPVLIGAPDFGPTDTARAKDRGGSLAMLSFPALPGTADEIRAVARVLEPRLGKAVLWTGRQASEARVKLLEHPAIVHLATHGFFLRPGMVSAPPGQRGLRLVSVHSEHPRPGIDPELASALAFAGVNAPGGSEDGVLTALEAASLDLSGTRLVVLSGCETGVGQVHGGEGVVGLRRAFALAGSETQIMSLWRVSDDATRDLMLGFYRRLLEGRGRAAALRDAQLELHGDRATAHPYFWAGFIVSGDPGPLVAAPAAPPEAPRATRGCSCNLPPAGEHGAPLAVLTLLLAATHVRRRSSPKSEMVRERVSGFRPIN